MSLRLQHGPAYPDEYKGMFKGNGGHVIFVLEPDLGHTHITGPLHHNPIVQV